ncbi:MAG: PLP-dependent aminotransferase family protein [Candidatus Acetothermia bacterium]
MKKNKTAEETIYFNRGIPSEESLPYDALTRVFPQLLEDPEKGLLRYGNSTGYPPLKRALSENYSEASEENLLIGNGSLQLLDLIASHYLSPGDTVIVENPTYDRALTIFERAGLEVAGVELEEDGLNLEELEDVARSRSPDLLYVIPDFQNPTGTTTGKYKRGRIVELAEGFDFTVIEDSPYRHLRYRGETLPTIRELGPDSTIQVSSFSKLISPGIRVGWLVSDPGTVSKLGGYAEDTYISPNQLSQGIVESLITEGWFSDRIDELIDLYRPRLEATLKSLERFFPEADWVEVEGGFFVGLWLPESARADMFYEKIEEKGLVLSSPEGFFPNEGGENFVRLPFPALKPAEIEKGVKRMAEAWSEL